MNIRTSLSALAGILMIGGCAKSPSGGPSSSTQFPNRLGVTLTLAQPLNRSVTSSGFYYAVAFDDDDDATDGPLAIVGPSDSENGVVSGSRAINNGSDFNSSEGFSVLILVRGGRFNVYRRTPRATGGEQLDRVTTAFVGNPTIQGNQIRFTLNLDAQTESSTAAAPVYLFRHDANNQFAPRALDTNFVTKSEIVRPDSSNQGRITTYDALGTRTSGFVPNGNQYTTFTVDNTQTFRNSNSLVRETPNDVFNTDGTVPDATDLGRLDITDFQVSVVRGSTS